MDILMYLRLIVIALSFAVIVTAKVLRWKIKHQQKKECAVAHFNIKPITKTL